MPFGPIMNIVSHFTGAGARAKARRAQRAAAVAAVTRATEDLNQYSENEMYKEADARQEDYARGMGSSSQADIGRLRRAAARRRATDALSTNITLKGMYNKANRAAQRQSELMDYFNLINSFAGLGGQVAGAIGGGGVGSFMRG